MLILIIAYFGGILTILSPCILPVLPFVFARADRPFRRNGLPMLAGMALTFAAVATLAAVGGGAGARPQVLVVVAVGGRGGDALREEGGEPAIHRGEAALDVGGRDPDGPRPVDAGIEAGHPDLLVCERP